MVTGKVFLGGRWFWTILLATLLVAFCNFCIPSAATATQSVKVGFAPAEIKAQPEEEFAVEIHVSDVSELYAVGIHVKYDSQIIEYIRTENGNIFVEQSYFDHNNDAQKGIHVIVATMLGETRGFSGDGVIATLVFRAIRAGDSDLSIAICELVDADVKYIDIQAVNGKVISRFPGTKHDSPQPPSGGGGGQQSLPSAGGGQPAQSVNDEQSNNEQNEESTPGLSGVVDYLDIKDHWAKGDVNYLAKQGIIRGYEDNTFRPAKDITRAEFAAIILRAIAGDSGMEGTLPFKDADKIPDWARGAVAVAAQKGLFKGDQQGFFRPGDPVTRAEITAVAVRLLGREKEVESFSKGAQFPFTDIDGSWASGYIVVASGTDLMKGYQDGTFRPGVTASRAEAAVMLVRLLKATQQ